MGQLDCQPDEMYLPANYSSTDLANVAPPALLDSASLVMDLLPPDVAQRIRSMTITVAPVQVRAPF